MDFKDFKKISSDKHSTVLQHAHGHQLRVAHAPLSPSLKKELDKLPVHKAEGGMATLKENYEDKPVRRFAAGGDTVTPAININLNGQPMSQANGVAPNGTPNALMTDQQQAEANKPAPPPQQAQPAPTAAPVQSAPQDTSADDGSEDTPDTPDAPAATAAPTQQPQQAVQPQVTPQQQDKDNYAAEDAAWQQDLVNQHVTPKTYQSMFERPTTLGKIGAIFGMMLSGAGSGLSHQPNAILEMMNKTIQNDLDAQKTSKGNAQNFLRLNLQHQLQDAQIHQMVKQGHLTDAQAQNAIAEANLKANTLSNIQANRAALHDLTLKVQNLPVGSPQRIAAEQQLALIAGAINNENYRIGDQAAAQGERLRAMGIDLSGQVAPGTQGTPTKENPTGAPVSNIPAQLRKMSAMGTLDPAQHDKAMSEFKMIENKQQINKAALDSFDNVSRLVTTKNRIMDPIQVEKQINAEWNPMLDKLTRNNEGRITPITVGMMNGLKPEWADSDATTNMKRQKMNEILNSGFSTPTLDGLNLTPKKEVPGQSKPATPSAKPAATTSKSSETPQEGSTSTSNGKPIIYKNGKWVLQ